ncbi:MAG: hypothetical protein AAGI38_09025 [Bacteroidota bacterium]
MKKYIWILLIIHQACTPSPSPTSAPNNPMDGIVLVDTHEVELAIDTASHLSRSWFYARYIGEKRDTIRLDQDSYLLDHLGNDTTAYQYPDSGDLRVFVDTSRVIGQSETKANWFTSNQGEFYWRQISVKSIPVVIENVSEKELALGYDINLRLEVEAKDSLGAWRTIQKYGPMKCGTGLLPLLIRPKEILVTSCKLFSGPFSTTMRIVRPSNPPVYSNEFWGQINYHQFQKKE